MKKNKLWIPGIAGMLIVAILLSLLVHYNASDVKAVTSDELKDQLVELEKEKDAISQQLSALEKEQSANLNDIESIIKRKNNIDQQVALLHAEIENVNGQIAAYSLLIADKQTELDEAEARLEALREQNKERIRAMEEGGTLSYWAVIFEANSFFDLLDRIDMIDEIARADKKRLEEMSQVAAEVEKARDTLTEEKANLELIRADLETSQKALEAKTAEADEMLAKLVDASEDLEKLHNQFEQMEEDFLDQIAQTEKEYNDKVAEELESSRKASLQASIDASIEASIAQESRLEASRKESSRQEANKKPTTGGAQGSDKNPSGVIWRVPCDYVRVSSPFGYRWHPTTGEYSMHRGVDLAAPKGTPIVASRSGVVTIATYHSTAGNYVTINHQDGYSSVYMHMTHYIVGVGDYVKAGEVIGYVGSTGRSTGPHLHFGISYNGTYYNPMDYIG